MHAQHKINTTKTEHKKKLYFQVSNLYIQVTCSDREQSSAPFLLKNYWLKRVWDGKYLIFHYKEWSLVMVFKNHQKSWNMGKSNTVLTLRKFISYNCGRLCTNIVTATVTNSTANFSMTAESCKSAVLLAWFHNLHQWESPPKPPLFNQSTTVISRKKEFLC